MSAPTIDRERLRTAARGSSRARGKALEPLTLDGLARGLVFALDPTISACGCALLENRGDALIVHDVDTIKPPSEGDGVEFDLRKGDVLFDRLRDKFRVLGRDEPAIEIAHEAPPTGGGKLVRTESSWTASRAVRDAARVEGLAVIEPVQIQAHKTLITGSGSADKSDVKKALENLVKTLPILQYPARTNDNVRDAICIGIFALHRRGQYESSSGTT